MNFSLFGLSHLIVIALTILLSAFTLLANKLSRKQNQRLSLLLAFLLGLQPLVFNSVHIFKGDFDLTRFLPFHLCTFAAYISIFALIFKKNWLDKLQYFFGLGGAVAAQLLPDIGANENFPAFRFIEFFWSHTLIIVISFYIIFNRNLKLKYIDIWKYFGVLNILAFGLVIWINKAIEANYMYLTSRPSGGQMDFLPAEPYHIFGLLGIFLLVFHLKYFVWKLFNRK